MAVVVNTNIGSMNAQRALTQSSLELRSAMERLSSGKKINSDNIAKLTNLSENQSI